MVRDFKISRIKIVSMECHFSCLIQGAKTTMITEANEIPQLDSFYYLSSIINKDGKIDEDVEQRIKVGWLK